MTANNGDGIPVAENVPQVVPTAAGPATNNSTLVGVGVNLSSTSVELEAIRRMAPDQLAAMIERQQKLQEKVIDAQLVDSDRQLKSQDGSQTRILLFVGLVFIAIMAFATAALFHGDSSIATQVITSVLTFAGGVGVGKMWNKVQQ